jgi:mannitol-specific phosphotransferase system IIBC component
MAESIPSAQVKTIVFACEAGMGSSLMGVNSLKRKFKKARVDVKVIHKPARAIPKGTQVVVVHKGLVNVVRRRAPDAVVVAFNHFLNDPVFDTIVQAFVDNTVIVQAG